MDKAQAQALLGGLPPNGLMATILKALIAKIEDNERLTEQVRLFPNAADVLTNQEMRDAKGNWRSLIDQQTNALAAMSATLKEGSPHG